MLFALGMVTLINPCGFALLPAYLGFFVSVEGDEVSERRIQSLNRAQIVGLSLSLGFLLVFGLIGSTIALLIVALMKGWFGHTPLMYAMKIPVIGKCLETIALSRLSWTFAISQEAGVDARRTIAMSLRSARAAWQALPWARLMTCAAAKEASMLRSPGACLPVK